MGQAGLTFWQRRYVLAHYREYDDLALAAGSGLSVRRVSDFRERMGATRSVGDLRRMEVLGPRPAPAMRTPATVRQALTRLTTRRLTRLDALLVCVMFLGSAALYAVTCARTVTGEDSGELLAAAHEFGVPHPPGYPLWLLLSWALDHTLPWLTVAWRVSMVSALSAAAANALLLAIALKTVRSRLAAFTGAALFAVSLTHWTQAVIPEVYALNACFVALQALQLILLAERPTAGRLLALAAVTGLSCTNHTSAFPVAVIVGLAAVLIAPQLLRSPAKVAGALVAGVLPLGIFFVLIAASSHDPYLCRA